MGDIQAGTYKAKTASNPAQGDGCGRAEKTIGDSAPSKSDKVGFPMGDRDAGFDLKTISMKRVTTGY